MAKHETSACLFLCNLFVSRFDSCVIGEWQTALLVFYISIFQVSKRIIKPEYFVGFEFLTAVTETFQKNISPPSSGSESKPRVDQVASKLAVRNVGSLSPDYTVLYPRRYENCFKIFLVDTVQK
jgi:hypothetical protein